MCLCFAGSTRREFDVLFCFGLTTLLEHAVADCQAMHDVTVHPGDETRAVLAHPMYNVICAKGALSVKLSIENE